MTDKDKIEKETSSSKKVFVPGVRPLSGDALKDLSESEKAFAKECEERGVWLEVFCPEDSCLSEEERIKLVAFCEESGKKADLWLKAFCPGDSCEVLEPTQLA